MMTSPNCTSCFFFLSTLLLNCSYGEAFNLMVTKYPGKALKVGAAILTSLGWKTKDCEATCLVRSETWIFPATPIDSARLATIIASPKTS